MHCPRCRALMQEVSLEGHQGRPAVIDLCHPCQAFWFDSHESLRLTPGSTLSLFRMIGERAAAPRSGGLDAATCPRCGARLQRTRDMQRTTRFEYLRCPNGHGRFTSFFEFLKEKDFVRPLTAQQIDELRQHVQTVNCSNCGGPVDLTRKTACGHCGSPLSMLDLKQAEKLVAQLQQAADLAGRPVDPALPLELARARRQVEQTFAALERDGRYLHDASSTGLVGAGLSALARWLSRQT